MPSIPDNQKRKRGRPQTGVTPLVGVRLPNATIERLDQWAKRNGFESRAEAIRYFIEIGMKAKRAN
jgi:metal-responsive CopG/Arc/MetJ family transcriptional regulator